MVSHINAHFEKAKLSFESIRYQEDRYETCSLNYKQRLLSLCCIVLSIFRSCFNNLEWDYTKEFAKQVFGGIINVKKNALAVRTNRIKNKFLLTISTSPRSLEPLSQSSPSPYVGFPLSTMKLPMLSMARHLSEPT